MNSMICIRLRCRKSLEIEKIEDDAKGNGCETNSFCGIVTV